MKLIYLLLLMALSFLGNTQKIKEFNSFLLENKGVETRQYFIVFGGISCESCYQELINYCTTKVNRSEVNILKIIPSNILARRTELKSTSKDYNINESNIYFTAKDFVDLINDNEEQLYPKIFIVDGLEISHVYNYQDLFNNEGMRKNKIKRLLK